MPCRPNPGQRVDLDVASSTMPVMRRNMMWEYYPTWSNKAICAPGTSCLMYLIDARKKGIVTWIFMLAISTVVRWFHRTRCRRCCDRCHVVCFDIELQQRSLSACFYGDRTRIQVEHWYNFAVVTIWNNLPNKFYSTLLFFWIFCCVPCVLG